MAHMLIFHAEYSSFLFSFVCVCVCVCVWGGGEGGGEGVVEVAFFTSGTEYPREDKPDLY